MTDYNKKALIQEHLCVLQSKMTPKLFQKSKLSVSIVVDD